MCDTLVMVPEGGPVLFAKNSDREAGEAQALERHPARGYPAGARLRCTWMELAQARSTNEVILSRPAWGWGAEMGVNAHGLAIGNEAVFTRLPVARTGLTGMDLLRLALERAATAEEGLEVLIGLLAAHPQGGGGGFRNRRFRYHNSFILADPGQAWVLETAGPYWAAQRVRGPRTISNVLSIGRDWDRLHPRAANEARRRGWSRGRDLDFARAFGDPFYRFAGGGRVRSACTLTSARSARTVEDLAAALSDHAGRHPAEGSRMVMPCAHGSWWPTRRAGQTTASLIAVLGAAPRVFATGTSSPCLSVFKPVPFGVDVLPPPARVEADPEQLWWRHERLHRLVLQDYAARRAAFEPERAALQEEAFAAAGSAEPWARHLARLPIWIEAAQGVTPSGRGPFAWWWARESRRDQVAR